MYKRVILIGYKLGSKSLRSLAQALRNKVKQKVLRVDKDSKTYKNKPTDYVISWGLTTPYNMGNGPSLVKNKLTFFEFIKEYNELNPNNQVNIPEWTTNTATAQQWIDDGYMVVGRVLLNSHSGKGIILFDSETITTNTECPLYVKYKKKKSEFRVHVFSLDNQPLQVIDVTQKKKRKDFEGEVNTKIRNHQNGWVYCREDITEPDDLRTQALRAATAVGIKHGAVDVIYNQHKNKCYVLEINSAPGIEGTTLEKYVDAFVKDMEA